MAKFFFIVAVPYSSESDLHITAANVAHLITYDEFKGVLGKSPCFSRDFFCLGKLIPTRSGLFILTFFL